MASAGVRRPLALVLLFALVMPSLPPSPAHAQPGFTNLLSNGGFEAGAVSWDGLTGAEISAGHAHGGERSARITSGDVSQSWVAVTPGQTYVLTGWFKWVTFAGSQWGYDYIAVHGASADNLASITSLHSRYEPNVWHKLALTVVASDRQMRVAFGMFGPQDQVELHFDDLALFARGVNQPPTATPSASTGAGAAPLGVAFQARADDVDGAVQTVQWLFGDGSEARVANPSHVFSSRGAYTVTLNVWDQDGAMASRTLSVSVTDAVNPEVSITAPTSQAGFSTTGATVTLGGQAATPEGGIASLTWDNLRTGAAGALGVNGAASLHWASPAIDLAPGANEILISAIDTRGRAHADRLVVTRQVSGPRIYAVQPGPATVRQYEQYEVAFKLDTVSPYPLFRYDASPPPGIAPGAGVTVEGVITTPSGRVLRHPAFYRSEVIRSAAGGSHYELAGQSGWGLRFAPTEQGRHQLSLSVRDASGAATVSVGSFTATAPARKGFITVSAGDSRYFSYSNGALFWPIGPAWAVDYAGGQGFNFDRPWMGGLGIYTTNWARWKSTAQQLGNEGFSSQLSYLEHYPGHELAQEIFYPEGYRMWIAGFIDEEFVHRLKPETNYQVQLRLKVVDLAGPRDPAAPYGLVAKLHGWPNEPGFEAENRASPSLIPRISVDRDWHTLVATYRTAADEGGSGRNDISIYLENVTAGRAFIDAFSVREILAGGGLGPELIRTPLADMHTYVEQRPAAAIDDQLAQGERDGIFFKYVVHDKNDWIQSRLLPSGIFAEIGDGYYQPAGTKARWLLEQWWRYVVARWGYSTAVHSWELNNEGPPDDGSGAHARAAQEFARFMRQTDAHPHLATTSFWCCWRPSFWGDRQRFPDVGYADIHEYVSRDDTFADGTPKVYDEARFQAESSLAYAGDGVGVPIIRGEVGFNGEPMESQLARPNPGLWFHNLLWAQLNAGALFDPGYWHRAHLDAIDAGAIARPFAAFVATLDLQRGGYVDVGAVVSNPELRVYGQRHPQRRQAVIWVQNRRHTWRNVMGVDAPAAITPQSGTVTLILRPDEPYWVEWWDTATGAVSRREHVVADGAGRVTLSISNLTGDLALKVLPETPDPAQPPWLHLPQIAR